MTIDTVPPPHCRPLRATVCTGCPARLGHHFDDDFETLALLELQHFEKSGCMGSVRFEAITRVAPAEATP